MEFSEHPVPAEASEVVESLWTLDSGGRVPVEASLVATDGSVELVVCLEGTIVGSPIGRGTTTTGAMTSRDSATPTGATPSTLCVDSGLTPSNGGFGSSSARPSSTRGGTARPSSSGSSSMLCQAQGERASIRRTDGFVLGIATGPQRFHHPGPVRLLGVRLRPRGALGLLGTDLRKLRKRRDKPAWSRE